MQLVYLWLHANLVYLITKLLITESKQRKNLGLGCMLGSANKGPSKRKGCLIYIKMDPDFTLGILKTISSFLNFLLLKKISKTSFKLYNF